MSDMYHHPRPTDSIWLDSANFGMVRPVEAPAVWKRRAGADELQTAYRRAGVDREIGSSQFVTAVRTPSTPAVGRDFVAHVSVGRVSRNQKNEAHDQRLSGPARLIRHVVDAWSLTNEELAALLGYRDPTFAVELLHGVRPLRGADREDRTRLIYLIHETLADLFVNPGDECRWMRAPLGVLNDRSPLGYMIANRIPGMISVHELVEQRLANR